MAVVNLPWSRGMCKTALLDDPDYPNQQKWKPKNEWKFDVECTSRNGHSHTHRINS